MAQDSLDTVDEIRQLLVAHQHTSQISKDGSQNLSITNDTVTNSDIPACP